MIESRKHKGHQRMICFAQAAQSKPRLQSSGESGIKTIVLLGGSLAGAESSTDSAQKRAFTFLLNLSSRRILSSLCPWLPRISRLNAQNPCRGILSEIEI